MARFFIDRPVFAIVLAILITLLGALAGFSLPIAQYPDITKPRITVSTNYVGASADTVEESVAQSLKQQEYYDALFENMDSVLYNVNSDTSKSHKFTTIQTDSLSVEDVYDIIMEAISCQKTEEEKLSM